MRTSKHNKFSGIGGKMEGNRGYEIAYEYNNNENDNTKVDLLLNYHGDDDVMLQVLYYSR